MAEIDNKTGRTVPVMEKIIMSDEEAAEFDKKQFASLPRTLNFKVGRGYNYTRDGLADRIQTAALRSFATAVLSVGNRAALGFSVSGRENLDALGKSGAVTVCNHVHMLDCTMIDSVLYPRRTYYVTLEENFSIPVVNYIVRTLGGVPLSKDPHAMAELFNSMAEAAKKGACVQIYPEGVLVPYCDNLRSFRGGAFRLAVDAGVPILPMVIKKEPPQGVRRLYKRKPCLRLVILPPVYKTPGLNPREAAADLCARTRAAMQAVLET
jgi:1-acyl-sn-glycerol-3-phosphate acyltransferase